MMLEKEMNFPDFEEEETAFEDESFDKAKLRENVMKAQAARRAG